MARDTGTGTTTSRLSVLVKKVFPGWSGRRLGWGIPPTPALALYQRGTTFFTERWRGMLGELLDQLFDAREKLLFGARVMGEA